MIYRLQRRFILICTASVLAVVLLVFLMICGFSLGSVNRNLDLLADGVSEGGGRFPDGFHDSPPPRGEAGGGEGFGFITSETPFATRHFTVWLDGEGDPVRVNTEFIHSVSEDTAREMAEKALDGSRERGWMSSYRYKVFSTEEGSAVVFIDGSTSRASLLGTVSISALVLVGCAALVILLVVLLSKRAVKPIAEGYEKQRQFVTDASHELKTPLTLFLANLDIAEAELGKNEWLDDIRAEGNRMTELVNRLVELSRMEEECEPKREEVRLGELLRDAVSELSGLCESRGRALCAEIDVEVVCVGDPRLLERLIWLLLDNAVKYCDDGGDILVRLERRRGVVLTVENSYEAVGRVELSRLFDRFYRADRARAFTGGYGIGLSVAKSIVEKHRGSIVAYQAGDGRIGFRATLRC